MLLFLQNEHQRMSLLIQQKSEFRDLPFFSFYFFYYVCIYYPRMHVGACLFHDTSTLVELRYNTVNPGIEGGLERWIL